MPLRARLSGIFAAQAAIAAIWFASLSAQTLAESRREFEAANEVVLRGIGERLERTAAELKTVTTFPILRQDNSTPTYVYKYLSDRGYYGPLARRTYLGEVQYGSQRMFALYPSVTYIGVADPEGDLVEMEPAALYRESRVPADAVWPASALAGRGRASFLLPDEPGLPGKARVPGTITAVRAIVNAEEIRAVGAVVATAAIDGLDELFEAERRSPSQRFSVSYSGFALAGAAGPARPRCLVQDWRTPSGFLCRIETPYALVAADALGRRWPLMAAFAVLLAAVLAATNAVVAGVLGPVGALKEACARLARGDFAAKVADPGSDELASLGASFDAMAAEIDRLVSEVYRKDLLANQIEMQLLRSQVNPHFLYNSLESIRAKALSKGDAETAAMAVSLGRTLRYGIASPRETVDVARELENLRDYLALQEARRGAPLGVRICVDDSILPLPLPRLVLQPVVENALVHGLDGRPGAGSVELLGGREGGRLVFRVVDDGAGMDGEKLEALRAYIETGEGPFSGIGLRNVHRRIRLAYGDGYGVRVESAPGRGTMVAVEVPVLEPEAAP